MDRQLAITIYENAKNPAGRGASVTYEQVKSLLKTHSIREEKDGKAFSPHRLKPGTTRANANVEYVSMAVADIDDGVTLEELFPLISQYAWIAVSSHSHTAEHHKFRLVFPLVKDIPVDEWPELRKRFRSLLGAHDDPATKDAARFYFFPSTTSAQASSAFYTTNDGPWLDLYSLPESGEDGLVGCERSGGSSSAEFVNEFGASKEFPPSSLVVAAQRCAALADFRDTGGSTEPIWYAYIGLAKHGVEGKALAHEWSSKYAQYSKAETDRKYDQWSTGPTTCDRISDLRPDLCASCAFKGKVTTPLQLGYVEVSEPPTIVEEQDSGGVSAQKLPFWPSGFSVVGDTLCFLVEDKEGLSTYAPVARPWFYLTERVESHDGTYSHRVRAEIRKGRWREFEIPAKSMADLRALKGAMASFEITVNNDKLLSKYYSEWANTLRTHVDEIKTYRQQGWNKEFNGFLIGDELIHLNGRTKVRVDRSSITDQRVIDSCEVRGTKEEWTAGVTELYDRENGLPYQYAILTQFASPLAPLLGFSQWNGIPLALTSDDSGYGKTTVAQIGINALSSSTKTMLSTITPKAIINRAGQMGCVPVLFDELTQHLQNPDDLASVCYDLSNGRGRVGLEMSGKEREAGLPFQLMATITANKNFFEKLAQAKVNPIATQMRIFEIPMESYEKLESVRENSELHAKHHELALHLVDNVSGVWADDYFQFILKNQQEVRDKLHSTAMAITTALGGNAARERYYAYHVACVLVAGWICKKIGAVSFNLNALKVWAMHHIVRMRATAQKYSNNTEELFAKFVTDLHGSILVTKHYDLLDAKRGNTEVPLVQLRGAPVARLVLGSDKERGKFFVMVRAVDEWCAKNDMTASKFKRMLASASLLRGGGEQGQGFDKKISLSKGVPSHPTGQARCFEFEYSAVQGYIAEVIGGNVVPLVKGITDEEDDQTEVTEQIDQSL